MFQRKIRDRDNYKGRKSWIGLKVYTKIGVLKWGKIQTDKEKKKIERERVRYRETWKKNRGGGKRAMERRKREKGEEQDRL